MEKLFQIKLTESIGVKLVSICKVWPRTGMRNRGVPQRCLARTPGTSEVRGMYPRYLHKGAQLISGKATHGMPCKIGQNALWYMRVMVWYKCDTSLRVARISRELTREVRQGASQRSWHSPRALWQNIMANDGHHERWKCRIIVRCLCRWCRWCRC